MSRRKDINIPSGRIWMINYQMQKDTHKLWQTGLDGCRRVQTKTGTHDGRVIANEAINHVHVVMLRVDQDRKMTVRDKPGITTCELGMRAKQVLDLNAKLWA